VGAAMTAISSPIPVRIEEWVRDLVRTHSTISNSFMHTVLQAAAGALTIDQT
jgi:hypothetical protein